ncbi:poly-beta-1,6-N-acetyl-D-glucosamine biosynthesis protein PgaD [Acinetobacter sp. 187]|uniref:poly-beta-1,6-N-acetyl-D-glucosamine biosynthesis protein PgaD n=1 Tax=Acinetobacter lanii TaxID=2715163 RepID=UPI00140D1D37|nr:poly-beta-1,6-N-acetyl-D-glucosamine biosynthesis protein PgaD [Acinetobacter lanii]NHC02194.1 poly-beta-1,6-N-acetyl-D-glucosamine biosynthesis protein PgaD [Acinetobacter lanii]
MSFNHPTQIDHDNHAIVSDPKLLDLPQYIDQAKFVRNKKGHQTLQFVGWVFWSFLFMPIFTLLLWIFQGNLIRNYIFAEKLNVQLLNIAWLAVLVLVFGATLLLWASFNWIRFRKHHIQPMIENVSIQSLANYLKISPQELDGMQHSKRVVLYYDENGVLYDYQMNRA